MINICRYDSALVIEEILILLDIILIFWFRKKIQLDCNNKKSLVLSTVKRYSNCFAEIIKIIAIKS